MILLLALTGIIPLIIPISFLNRQSSSCDRSFRQSKIALLLSSQSDYSIYLFLFAIYLPLFCSSRIIHSDAHKVNTTMLATSTVISFKHSATSLSSIKKVLLGITLYVSVLNPIVATAQSNYDIQQLEQQKADYQLQKDNLVTETIGYMMLTPKASAALFATGGGVAAILEKNLTGAQKAVFVGMGLLGMNHCRQSENIQKCAEVATNIGSYATQINNYDEQINSLTEQINSSQDYATNTAPSYPPENSWIPGTPHPEFDNVVAGDKEGIWQPASGYEWVNPEDNDDFRVITHTYRLIKK
jgi:hypothetical protein